ncbi:DUF2512 family protein [Bacillus taeanensis]|uniref:DUF2512 domain-containing protein n=1 Tax=Bacillus taeanensis TaxID=273032 RepID=A0A366XVQ2_9BACI|nr:DUF2512 family protein [Bacillus taeanensis]RBW69648.1 hypothetical protein DS031_10510 [Bacillus taeanensis]
MTGLLIKLVVCPITVIFASYLFPTMSYDTIYQPIIVGLVLAFASHMMELFLLKPGTFWISTFADFIAATIIVYVISMFFEGAYVPFVAALFTGFLLAVTEYFQHQWLLKYGKTLKGGPVYR